jgi:hypothetical protein
MAIILAVDRRVRRVGRIAVLFCYRPKMVGHLYYADEGWGQQQCEHQQNHGGYALEKAGHDHLPLNRSQKVGS